ncbi:ribose-5-phosphate isomerase A [Lactobacillus johnsonii]|uniref:ribose-5-phosphate isomerase A n=1 Tax=Lactobacillus johnsonii TaxID=33959 RepID=UPI001474C75A|nr:ribose-5-phosphate isomerase A [Lactobacillus johnsonii]NME19874.1 ribose-5-phosphate isomerase A [Lactobacillus johnsonii]
MSLISQKALSKIKPNMSISLGGGSNVLNLAKDLCQAHISNLTLYSPSEITQAKCKQFGLKVLPFIENLPHLDLAFDGCDSIDKNFNALKSGGGIHLFEKLAAENTEEYILLLPAERFRDELSPTIPLCLENVINSIPEEYDYKIRLGKAVASFARSPLGNILIDIYPHTSWNNIKKLNSFLLKQNGVVSSSYFEGIVTSIITETKNKAVEIKKG